MLRGVTFLADAVKVTLGLKVRNVLLKNLSAAPLLLKRWVTVAQEIELENAVRNTWAAPMVKEVASQANDVAGDGKQQRQFLASQLLLEGLKAVAADVNAKWPLARQIDKAACSRVKKCCAFYAL